MPSARAAKPNLALVQSGIRIDYFKRLNNMSLEMSIEEYASAIPITLFLIPFVFITSFQIVRNSAGSLGLV
jgi:hypothetical protein